MLLNVDSIPGGWGGDIFFSMQMLKTCYPDMRQVSLSLFILTPMPFAHPVGQEVDG